MRVPALSQGGVAAATALWLTVIFAIAPACLQMPASSSPFRALHTAIYDTSSQDNTSKAEGMDADNSIKGPGAQSEAPHISLSRPRSPARTGMCLARAVYHAAAETCSLSSSRFSVGGGRRETSTANEPQTGIKL
jgi:hypothetical protein